MSRYYLEERFNYIGASLPYTAHIGETIIVVTTGSGTINLPLSTNLVVGDWVTIYRVILSNTSSPMTISGNGVNINNSSTMSFSGSIEALFLTYNGSEWRCKSGV